MSVTTDDSVRVALRKNPSSAKDIIFGATLPQLVQFNRFVAPLLTAGIILSGAATPQNGTAVESLQRVVSDLLQVEDPNKAARTASKTDLSLLQHAIAGVLEQAMLNKADALCKYPSEVHMLVERKCVLGSEQHRQCIKSAVKFIVNSIPFAFVSPKLKASIRKIFGLSAYFATNLQWAGQWTTLKDGCTQRMQHLGNILNSKWFESLGLGQKLGSYVPSLMSTTKQNMRQPMVPAECARELRQPGDDPTIIAKNLFLERTYIHFLRLIAIALDEPFAAAVTDALADLLVGGSVSTGGIKGYQRMHNKMMSPEDHYHEAVPRPACNIDIVRCLAVFATAEEMLDAFSRLSQVFGPYVKFKNGMAWPQTKAQSRFHLRIVLGTVSFQHSSLPTIGKLRSDPKTRNLWQQYAQREAVPRSTSRTEWRQHVATALKWIDAYPADSPAKIFCEVQMLLQPYRDIRHEMHEIYKVVRASTPDALDADFARSIEKDSQAAKFRADGATPFMIACRDGDKGALEKLLANNPQPSQQQIIDGLCLCCKYVRSECFSLLAQRSSKCINATGSQNQFALFQSCLSAPDQLNDSSLDEQRLAIVQRVLDLKADLRQKASTSHKTALMVSASNGLTSVVKKLLLADSSRLSTMQRTTKQPRFTTQGQPQDFFLHPKHSKHRLRLGSTSSAERCSECDKVCQSPCSMYSCVRQCNFRVCQQCADAIIERHRNAESGAVSKRFTDSKRKVANSETVPPISCGIRVVIAAEAFRAWCCGTIVQDDEDDKPCKVRFEDGLHYWYERSALQRTFIDDIDTSGSSALFYATRRNHCEILEMLCAHKADVNVPLCNGGSTSLMVAADFNHIEALSALLHQKADINATNTQGCSATYLSVQRLNLEALACLLGSKADPSIAQSAEGITPVIMAVQVCEKENVRSAMHALELLLRSKADPNQEDAKGRTPLAIAKLMGRNEAASKLEEFGGKEGCPRELRAHRVAPEGYVCRPDYATSMGMRGPGYRPDQDLRDQHNLAVKCTTTTTSVMETSSKTAPNSESAAILAKLFHSCNGKHWRRSDNWLGANSGPWFGVSCDARGDVVKIDMPSNNLQGTLPADLANLKKLFSIDLSRNKLNGSIPSRLGEHGSLRFVDFSDNRLSGIVPSAFAKVATRRLDNNLLGDPAQRQVLKKLFEMTGGQNWTNRSGWMDKNLSQHVGVQCDALGNTVVTITLTSNNLVGRLPPDLSRLSSLSSLNFETNKLSGEIPKCLGAIASLEHLNLANNQLEGLVPLNLMRIQQQGNLNLSGNKLGDPTERNVLKQFYQQSHGTQWKQRSNWCSDRANTCEWYGLRSDALGNFVLEIWLDDNKIKGELPPAFGKLTRLTHFNLSRNLLVGTIPAEIGRIASLQLVDLSDNQLVGRVPKEFSRLAEAGALNLVGNQLGDPIERQHLINFFNKCNGTSWVTTDDWCKTNTSEWFGLTCDILGNDLLNLELPSNNVQGVVPNDLCELRHLKVLDLRDNSLTGKLPLALVGLRALEILHLNGNEMTGRLPGQLAELSHLKELTLHDNKFIGRFPKSLIRLKLEYVDLAGNKIDPVEGMPLKASRYWAHGKFFAMSCVLVCMRVITHG